MPTRPRPVTYRRPPTIAELLADAYNFHDQIAALPPNGRVLSPGSTGHKMLYAVRSRVRQLWLDHDAIRVGRPYRRLARGTVPSDREVVAAVLGTEARFHTRIIFDDDTHMVVRAPHGKRALAIGQYARGHKVAERGRRAKVNWRYDVATETIGDISPVPPYTPPKPKRRGSLDTPQKEQA